jgi:hypothetical protein
MVRTVKGHNSNESECESVFHRFPCLAKMLTGGNEQKFQAVFKNIIVSKKKVQILRSEMNVHVITYCPISLNYGRVKLISL